MSKSFEGIVVAKARSGKGLAFNIDGEDTWFNARSEDQIPDSVGKGTVVAFEYKTSTKGGRMFRNIEGEVEVLLDGDAEEAPSRGGGKGRSGGGGYQRGGGGKTSAASSGYAGKSSGGGPDWRDVQIVRQNALTQANKLAETFPELIENDGNPDDVAAQVIALARLFEAYVFETEN